MPHSSHYMTIKNTLKAKPILGRSHHADFKAGCSLLPLGGVGQDINSSDCSVRTSPQSDHGMEAATYGSRIDYNRHQLRHRCMSDLIRSLGQLTLLIPTYPVARSLVGNANSPGILVRSRHQHAVTRKFYCRGGASYAHS